MSENQNNHDPTDDSLVEALRDFNDFVDSDEQAPERSDTLVTIIGSGVVLLAGAVGKGVNFMFDEFTKPLPPGSPIRRWQIEGHRETEPRRGVEDDDLKTPRPYDHDDD